MKIVFYLDHLEHILCCQVCATIKKQAGFISMEQQTFKLATVFTFICSYGNYFSIAPEHADKTKIDSWDNFKNNFCFIPAMQIFGKGLQNYVNFPWSPGYLCLQGKL